MKVVLPLTVLGGLLVVDLRVFRDAANHARDGDPVTLSLGSFTLESPGAWLVACWLLSIIFFPLYFLAREAN